MTVNIRPRRDAFTCLELVIVVLIVATLVSFLIPVILRSRIAASRMSDY